MQTTASLWVRITRWTWPKCKQDLQAALRALADTGKLQEEMKKAGIVKDADKIFDDLVKLRKGIEPRRADTKSGESFAGTRKGPEGVD